MASRATGIARVTGVITSGRRGKITCVSKSGYERITLLIYCNRGTRRAGGIRRSTQVSRVQQHGINHQRQIAIIDSKAKTEIFASRKTVRSLYVDPLTVLELISKRRQLLNVADAGANEGRSILRQANILCSLKTQFDSVCVRVGRELEVIFDSSLAAVEDEIDSVQKVGVLRAVVVGSSDDPS